MEKCITNLVNETDIKKPLSTGDFSTNFNEYCKKRSNAMDCVTPFTKSIEPCAGEEEKKHKTVLHFTKIIGNLLDFVCIDDGAQTICECFS